MHDIRFKRLYHKARGPKCSGNHERTITSSRIDNSIPSERALFESLPYRYQITQLGTGYQPNLAVVSSPVFKLCHENWKDFF